MISIMQNIKNGNLRVTPTAVLLNLGHGHWESKITQWFFSAICLTN